MSKIAIVGDGLLGNQISDFTKKLKTNLKIIKNVNYEQKEVIPKNTKTLIITAQSPDYRREQFTSDLLYVNTIMPMQLIREAYEKGVKKIAYCSTGSVYDPKITTHKESDSIRMKKITPYISSKYAAETLIKAWEDSFVSVTIFRPFFIYGSRQNNQMLFARIFDSVIKSKEIKLSNKKGLVFNPIHVFDAARFVLMTINKTEKFQIYNLAGNKKTTLHQIILDIGKIVKKKPIISFIDKKEDVVLGSIEKMKSIGFTHKISIQMGLKEMFTGNLPN